jgi:DNA polymerase-3 subunit epsilon
VALRERGPRGGSPEWMQDTDLHVVDHWAYLGTARTEEELDELRLRESNAAFDVDVYRILMRYFAKNPKLDWLDLRRAEQPVS